MSIAKPNQILIGESIYNILLSSESVSHTRLIEIDLDPTRWKYLSHFDPESMYRVYEYLKN